MTREEISAIAHGSLRYCNPLSSSKTESVFPLLGLKAGSRAIEFGCGKAELLLRLAELHGIHADGIDRSPFMLGEARAEAKRRGLEGRVRLHEMAARDFPSEAGSYELAVAMGSTHVFGDYPTLLRELARCVRPGGTLLVAEGYWKRPPDPEYLASFGGTEDELRPHAENVTIAEDQGLIPLHAVTASEDEWDQYEWTYSRTLEQHALKHPEVPELREALTRIRAWRRSYLRWGRQTMGFALYVFAKPRT